MKIAAATVSMDAAHTYREVDQRFTAMGMVTGATSGQTDGFGIRLATMLASSTQTQCVCSSEVGPICNGAPLEAGGADQEQGRTAMLAQIAGQVIGRQTTVGALQSGVAPSPQNSTTTPLVHVQTARLTSGIVYSQEESLLFSAQGTVQTTDGREIAFDLGLSMERSTVFAQTASVEVSNLFIDPLVLQFDLDSPLLGDSSFLFDLDSDGVQEELACPGGGCGFLALDRNNDGVVNNGLELFGPSSGSGFGELAELDSDANQWIDENDPIFDQLRIWSPDGGDGEGGGSFLSLREAGVGAIAVVHAGTEFQLQKPDGTVMGTIKASGVFLTEAGEVRPLQEVDLALPGTRADIGPDASESSPPGLQAALQSLRDIVGMQRLRLQTALAGERLRPAAARKAAERETFFDWLRSREQWRPAAGGTGENDQSVDPGVARVGWLERHGRAHAEKS
jgi:hypothetical protein